MRRLALLLLSLAAMLPVRAQSDQVSLRLFLPESTICNGTGEVSVRLEIRNAGSAPLAIDTTAVGSGFDAIALYSTESNSARFESLQVTGDRIVRPAKRSIVLQPRATHEIRGAIVLDPSFFSEPGFYKVRTDYSERHREQKAGQGPRGGLHSVSNWVILQVESCSADRKPRS